MTSSIVSIPISLQTTGPSEPGLSQREAPGVGAGHLQADPLFALVVTQVKGPQGEEVPQLLPARWGQVRLEAVPAAVTGPGGRMSYDRAETSFLINFCLFCCCFFLGLFPFAPH